MPKVSIVMPTYNAEKYLKQSIDSIMAQTFLDYELLIIDDNSKDKTRKIVKSYQDKRIKLIEGPCKGIAAALNAGLDKAEGEYIARMDADDISLPTRLEKQVVFMEVHPEISLVSTPMYFFNGRKILSLEGRALNTDETRIALLFRTPIFHPTVMFRKSDFAKHGMRYDERLKASEDFDLWTRAVQVMNFEVMTEPLLKYRVGNVKATSSRADETRLNSARIIINNFKRLGVKITENIARMLDPYNSRKFEPLVYIEAIKALKSLYQSNNNQKIYVPELLQRVLNCKALALKKYMTKPYEIKKAGVTTQKTTLISSRNLLVTKKLYGEEYRESIFCEDTEVNVCLAVNNDWSPFAASTIASIMENTASKVNFYILDSNISSERRQKIDALKKQYSNLYIEYIKINPDKDLKAFKSKIGYISVDTFSRFLFPQLKPKIERVIYTDVDVVFVKDITELYLEDLEHHTIGAVKGPYHDNGQDNKRLKIDKKHDYFQAGLLLIDCNKWRQNDIMNKIKNVNKDYAKILKYADQDILNIVFENNYKRLGYKYCVMPAQKKLYETFCTESAKAVKEPFIIHYCGSKKPWLTWCEFADHFWKYMHKTEFFTEFPTKLYSKMQSKGIIGNKVAVKLLSFLPIYSRYIRGGRCSFRILDLPVLTIRKLSNQITTKVYSFGIPIFKISKKQVW